MEYLNVTDIKPGVEYFQQDFGAKNISRESILFVSIDMEKGTATTTTSTYPIRKNKEGHWEIEDTQFGYVDPARNRYREKEWHALVIYAPPPPSEEEIELNSQREEFNSKVFARFEEAKTELMKTVGRELNDEEFNQLRHDVFTQILIEEQLLEKEKLRRNLTGASPVDIAALKEDITPQVAFAVSKVNECIQKLKRERYKDVETHPNLYDMLRTKCMEDVYSKMYKSVHPKGCGAGCSIAGGRTKKSKRSKRIKKWKRSTRRHHSF